MAYLIAKGDFSRRNSPELAYSRKYPTPISKAFNTSWGVLPPRYIVFMTSSSENLADENFVGTKLLEHILSMVSTSSL